MSLRSLMKPIALGGVVASLALLAGCNKSDGGGGSSPTTTYTGSGGETFGTWVLVVTKASGYYQDKHFAPVGLTVGVNIEQNGHDIQLYQDVEDYSSNWITLYADTVNKNYQGALDYTYYNDDLMYGQEIRENWTLTPTSNGIAVHIVGQAIDTNNNTNAVQNGVLDAVLKPVVGYTNSITSSDWFSSSSKSDEPLRNGEGGVYEEYDESPGTYVYYYWDAAWDWEDYLYIDQMYRDGNVLRGGGWYDGDWADDYKSTFGTIEVALDGNGHPISSSAHLIQGYGAGTTNATITHPHYDNAKSLELRYDTSGTSRDLHIDTVTAGGEMEQYVGAAGTTISGAVNMSTGDFRFYFSPIGNLYAGNVAGNTATWTVFTPGEYFYAAPDYPSYDLDSEYGTVERDIVTVNFDATTHIPTGGTWKLEVYSPSLTLQSVETMTFTIP